MKKRELRNGNKIVSALCVFAIVATLVCQFIPYWSYTGVIQNKEIGEERAVEMSSSIAAYCWLPNSDTSNAFEEYVKDPTVYYGEIVETVEYAEEELEAIKGSIAALDEEVIVEDAEEPEETAADTTADAEETTDVEAVENEEAEAEVIDENAGETETIKGMLVTIKKYEKDAADVTEVDEMVKETYGSLDDNELVNTLTGMPVIAFVIAILGILVALYKFKKVYIPAIATFIVGAYSLATYLTQPVFRLSGAWNAYIVISGIVAAIGVVMALYDFFTGYKMKKAAKAAAEGIIEA